MIITKREWLSESAQEAILYIGKESTACAAFSHPCTFDEGESLSEPLLAISVEGVVRVDEKHVSKIKRQGDTFAHTIIAKVIDKGKALVSSGSVIIELEEGLPGDINNGDIVEFSCGRLDVIR